MYRPKGWENQDEDILKLVPTPDEAHITQYSLIKTRYAAFEAGADAMLEGLKNGSLPVGGYRKYDDGLIKTLPVSKGLPYGYLVFIPEEKE